MNRFGDPGDDGIEGGEILEIFRQRVVVEGRVGSGANLANPCGQFGDTLFQEGDRVGCGVHIAGQINSFPDIGGFALETKKRLIGRPASLLGIEADAGPFLLPEDRQYFGVEIEDDGRKRIGLLEERAAEAVVEILKGGQASGSEAIEKASQRGGVRIGREAGQILEDTILLEENIGFDSFQTEDERIKNGEDGIADRIAVVELVEANILAESGAQFDILEKLLEKEQPPKVG